VTSECLHLPDHSCTAPSRRWAPRHAQERQLRPALRPGPVLMISRPKGSQTDVERSYFLHRKQGPGVKSPHRGLLPFDCFLPQRQLRPSLASRCRGYQGLRRAACIPLVQQTTSQACSRGPASHTPLTHPRGPSAKAGGLLFFVGDEWIKCPRNPRTGEATDGAGEVRRCPKCDSDQYVFRHRKKIEAVPEKGEPAAIEVKRRCKACGHEWREREPVKEAE